LIYKIRVRLWLDLTYWLIECQLQQCSKSWNSLWMPFDYATTIRFWSSTCLNYNLTSWSNHLHKTSIMICSRYLVWSNRLSFCEPSKSLLWMELWNQIHSFLNLCWISKRDTWFIKIGIIVWHDLTYWLIEFQLQQCSKSWNSFEYPFDMQ
jgi:hypothetical protein